MKNILSLLILFNYFDIVSQTIVSTSSENKNAIVEESTGIHCSYCPDGHAILNQLVSQNPDDIFVIKFHEGGYAWDCDPNGGHDFNNDLANQLGNMGQATGQPSASINRQVFSNFSMTPGGTAMSRGNWGSAISQVIQESSYVNVGVEAEIVGNQLIVHAELFYTEDSPESINYLNIAILQNETIGPQMGSEFNPDYIVSSSPNSNYQHGEYDYKHMNRLVDMIHGLSGDEINETSQGTFIDRYYYYNLPAYYNDVPVDFNEIEVVAFVTDGDEIQTGFKSEAVYTQYANDIAIGGLLSPSGISPSSNEQIIVSVLNAGVSTISEFEITYQLNDGEIVSENWSGSLQSGNSVDFTFQQTFDLTQYNDFIDITIEVIIPEDEYLNNNLLEQTIEIISYCPTSMDCSYGDGFQYFELADIQSDSGCEGYADFTNLSTEVNQGETYQLIATTGYGDQNIRIWIDFNDDNEFSLDELLIDNWIIAPGSASGSYTESVEFTIPNDAPLGSHRLRAKTNWQAPVPDDACETTQYGETEDYTIEVVESLSLNENENFDFKYYYNPINNMLIMSSGEKLSGIQIFNILGQKIIEEDINNYNYQINLNNLTTSIYFIQVKSNDSIKSFKLRVR